MSMRDRSSNLQTVGEHGLVALVLLLAGMANAIAATHAICMSDTTQADFALGTAQNLDIDAQPDSVILAQTMPGAFASMGTYISSIKDADPAPGLIATWPSLSWTTTTPMNTDIRFQVAASNSSTGPFDFVGPSGTSTSFFITPGASLQQFNGKRFLRYRAVFTSGDAVVTPTLSDVTVCLDAQASPDLALGISANRTSVAPGQDLVYTLTASNSGPIGAVGATLRVPLPMYTSFISSGSSAGWTCTPDTQSGSICVLPISPIAAGATSSATIVMRLRVPVPAGVFDLVSTASLTADGDTGADPVPGNNETSLTTPINAAPNLDIQASDGGATTAAGRTLLFRVLFSNIGTRDATGVALHAVIPEHTTFNPAASHVLWTCVPDFNAGAQCTNPVGYLGRVDRAANFAVTLDPGLDDSVTQITYSASISDDGSNGLDPQPGNNRSTDTTPVYPKANLSIATTVTPDPAIAGANLDMAISLANSGPYTAKRARWNTTLPPQTVFVSLGGDAGWACATPAAGQNGAISCTKDTFAPGTQTFMLRTLVDRTVPTGTVIAHSATVAASQSYDEQADNNTSMLSINVKTQADLAVTQTASPDPVHAGGNLFYAINVSNAGPSDAASINLNDALPAHTRFIALSAPAGWNCSTPAVGATGNIDCGTASMSDAPANFSVAVKVDDDAPGGATLTSTVSVSATSIDAISANNTAATTITVSGRPTIAAQSSLELLEDQTSAALAIDIADAETPPDSLKFFATSNDQSLITNASLAAGLSGNGAQRALVITPRADAFGTAIVTLSAADSDGNLTQRPLTVNITPVNDAPSAVYMSSRSHATSAVGQQVVANFASIISAGPANEGAQAIDFNVIEVDDADQVVDTAQIDGNGTLIYTLSGHDGSATLRARIHDNGGTANGGRDLGEAYEFKIVVGDGVDLSTHIARTQPTFLPLASVANGGATLASYDIVLTNHGTRAANGATLRATVPEGLINVLWTCTTGASNCVPASGGGNANVLVALNVGDSARLRISGTIDLSRDEVRVLGEATPPTGLTAFAPQDDSAQVSDPIVEAVMFGDGFE